MFCKQSPPVFRQGMAPQENMLIYNSLKANATKQQGVNDITYGQAPTAQSSNALADTLIRQNSMIITGEANNNLDECIEHMVEARILCWRQAYTKERWYLIEGEFQPLKLSEYLKSQPILDPSAGEVVGQKEIPMFEVEIKQSSNVAYQWENDLDLYTKNWLRLPA